MNGKTRLPQTYNFVQDILTPGRVTAVIGGKCCGKSFFAAQLSLSAAEADEGVDFLGYYTPRAKVLYLDIDGCVKLNTCRVYDMCTPLQCDYPLGDRMDSRFLICDVHPDDWKIDRLYDLIHDKFSAFNPGLIVIDPIWLTSNEEKRESVEHLMTKLRALCREFCCAVLYTHFPNGGYTAEYADIRVNLGNPKDMYIPRDIYVETRQTEGCLPSKIAFRYPIFERPVAGRTYRGDDPYVRRD